MNEIREMIVKGLIVDKRDILANPNKYKNQVLVCFSVGREYLQKLKLYRSEVDLTKPLEVKMKPWPEEITDRARRFFFELRDRVAKAQGDETRQNKDHLYRSCLLEYTGLKSHMSDLNKQELWQCTELMFRWSLEAEAYIGDLQAEYHEVKEGLGL